MSVGTSDSSVKRFIFLLCAKTSGLTGANAACMISPGERVGEGARISERDSSARLVIRSAETWGPTLALKPPALKTKQNEMEIPLSLW